jgi:hypothetical protein
VLEARRTTTKNWVDIAGPIWKAVDPHETGLMLKLHMYTATKAVQLSVKRS